MQKTEFHLKPSRWHLCLLAAALICCLMIILFLLINLYLKICLLMLLSIYGNYLWQRANLKNKDAILTIKKFNDGEWVLRTQQATYNATLKGDSLITPRVCVLRFHIPERPHLSCLIFPDVLSAQEYRRLMVLTRW